MLETEPQLIADYVATGQAKIVYRHLTQLGDLSVRTAEASECAGDQGKFWEMRYMLYERQDQLYAGDGDAVIAEMAADLGMDDQTFGACMASNKYREAVLADNQDAQDRGVRGRPVFDINGNRLVGALPLREFERAIEGQ